MSESLIDRIPWPLVRLAAIIAVVLVTGLAGLEPGVRTAGGLLILFAIIQLLRRYTGSTSSCEVSGQMSSLPALLLLGAQTVLGLFLLVWPGTLLGFLGAGGP